MTRMIRGRKPLLVLLLLVAAFALVIAGVAQSPSKNQAAAAFPSITFIPTSIIWPFWAVDVTPADGATEVPVDTNVIVLFNHDVDESTLTSNSFYLLKNGVSPVAAVISYDDSTRTATLDPVASLEPATEYVITLTGDIEDTGGTPLWGTITQAVPVHWSFTTESRPMVIAQDPAPGQTGVPIDKTISVTFDKNMNATTFTSGNFYLRKSGSASSISATRAYNATSHTATLDPTTDLEPNTVYQVTLTSGIKSVTGLSLEEAPVTWSFTTGGPEEPEPEAPALTAKVPANGATGVPVGQTISATFDQDMDATTLTSATFYVQKQGGSPLPATVSYDPASRTATLDPLSDLEQSATYLVTLSSAVKSSAGKSLSGAPVTWSFTTETGAGPTPSGFSDVQSGHPYYEAINGMKDAGIIEGYQVGDQWEFRPGNTVLRAQFAKMICGVMGLTVTEDDWPNPAVPFTDLGADVLPGPGVVNSLYPHEYVAVAYLNQITKGQTATAFAPMVGIKRAQVVTMIVRAAQNLRPGTLQTPPASWPGTLGSFDPTHAQYMRIAEYNGLLNGLVGFGPSWDPWQYATRGETAQILWNLMAVLP